MRRIRRESTAAVVSALRRSKVTSTPTFSAMRRAAASSASTSELTSVSSRVSTAAPASNREISSRSASMPSNRSISWLISSADLAVRGSSA